MSGVAAAIIVVLLLIGMFVPVKHESIDFTRGKRGDEHED